MLLQIGKCKSWKSEGALITKEDFLKGKYKVLPRIMMLVSTIMSWNTASWFMNLEDPTAPQSAFVSVVMGVMTGIFGIWM